ncbi:putative mitotubule-associated protein Gb4 [Trypanosoma grayi]|uniref:putative mitotubule-associated protein Gb4 n=1 Tax=Trypanosoma grayi TaxID=71804 RepID=UPI0004F47B4A|nr:putative mitotubule-associated protein Gb4 [Trypanosoma grayi]KEG05587.1 putative mitotubule-associated protein Gb4 [Trypanosoma grayi]
MQNGDHPPETEEEPEPEQESEEPAMQMGEPKDEEPKEGHVDEVEQPKTIGSAKAGKTKHTIRFRGAKWGTVLEKNSAELEAAFKKDVVEATGLDDQRIEKLQFRFTDAMVANFFVRHQNDAEKMAEVHATLQSYNFPRTTGVYRGRGFFTARIPGAKWAPILASNRTAVESSFRRDVREATGMGDASIGDVAFEATDALLVKFSLRHGNQANKRDMLNKTLQSYKFPHTTHLYGGKSKHIVRFRGDKWGTVLEKKRAALESAFKKDVVELTGLDEKRLVEFDFQFSDAMVATFSVILHNDAERMDEVHNTLQSYSFPHTTALYGKS